jgi:hypothetical protein
MVRRYKNARVRDRQLLDGSVFHSVEMADRPVSTRRPHLQAAAQLLDQRRRSGSRSQRPARFYTRRSSGFGRPDGIDALYARARTAPATRRPGPPRGCSRVCIQRKRPATSHSVRTEPRRRLGESAARSRVSSGRGYQGRSTQGDAEPPGDSCEHRAR